MPAAVIHTDALSKIFDGRPAVADLSLSVARGSVYAFLGPNGAGKSTTIRMLLGLLQPSGGRVALFGQDFARHRREILERTGSLVESPSVYPHLTARENLRIPQTILGAPRSDIDRVLEIVGLAQTGHKLVKAFSLGMKQRLALAQAMLGKRELLILDEPTNGLDPAGITEIRTLVKQLPGQHGITVFLSSHLLGEVEQMATHVGILSQGVLVFQGTAAELAQTRQSRLRIRVNRTGEACALLASRGWLVNPAEDGILTESTGSAAAMNRVLIEAGHDVQHLAIERASLEDVFLGMTQAGMQ